MKQYLFWTSQNVLTWDFSEEIEISSKFFAVNFISHFYWKFGAHRNFISSVELRIYLEVSKQVFSIVCTFLLWLPFFSCWSFFLWQSNTIRESDNCEKLKKIPSQYIFFSYDTVNDTITIQRDVCSTFFFKKSNTGSHAAWSQSWSSKLYFFVCLADFFSLSLDFGKQVAIFLFIKM